MSIGESMERRAEEFVARYGAVRQQLSRVIVGHDDIIHGVLTCLFVGGIACSRACPAWARRSWYARWPRRFRCTFHESSSRPI